MEMNSEREKQRTIIGHDRISDVCVTSRSSLVEKLNVIKRGFVAQNLPRLLKTFRLNYLKWSRRN